MNDATTNFPILLVRSGGPAIFPAWRATFGEVLQGVEVREWDDPAVDPVQVHYVLVWEPEPGRLAGYPNLRVIFSSAAGVDHITRDPDWPRHVPIMRMSTDETAQTMGEYICLGALAILRDLPRMLAGQRAARWDEFEPERTACTTRVGIMGLGNLGLVAARMLQGLGFPVHGWVRTPRAGEGVRCFAGMAELAEFLACTDIVVAILPDTADTRGLLDAEHLAKLPRGAGLVSVGRGSLIPTADLLAALDSGQLGMAVLDVFETEPLPADHPAWRHPRILISSHIAGYASRRARAAAVAEGLAIHLAGGEVPNRYDPARGY